MKIIKLAKKHKEIIFLFFLTVFFFYKLFLYYNQMLYPAYDAVSVYSFLKQFLVENVMHSGTIPLWNPSVFSGIPFIGDTEANIFYPLSILFFFFPINQSFGYLFALDTFLAGVFTYYFAKAINLDRGSAFISAIVFMFAGALTVLIFPAHAFVHSSIIWLPLILLLYEKALQKNKFIYIVLSALVMSCMIFAGFIQVAMYTIFSAVIYFYGRYALTAANQEKLFYSPRLLFFPLISLVLSFCLSSIQLLPAAELSRFSPRNGGVTYDFASDFSLPPKQLISLFIPHFFGDPVTYWGRGNFWAETIYIGLLPLFLSMIALFFKRNKYILIFSIFMIFSLLFSFGRYFPLFSFFYYHIPFFNLFRVPARFLYVFSFSIAILAGFGTSFLLSAKINPSAKKIISFLASCMFFLGTLGVLAETFMNKIGYALFQTYILGQTHAIDRDHKTLYAFILNDITVFSLIFLVSSVFLLLKMYKRINNQKLLISFCIIIIVDLWSFGVPLIQTESPNKIFAPPHILQDIQKDKSVYRVMDLSIPEVDFMAKLGIENVAGHNPAYLKDYRDFLWLIGDHYANAYDSFLAINSIENITIAQLLNVKYVISKTKINDQNLKLIDDRDLYLYLLKKHLPRVFVVPNAVVIQDKKQILFSLKKQIYDPTKTIILEKNPSLPLNNTPQKTNFSLLHYTPNKIIVRGSLTQSGFLFFSEIWYPGWHAYDNGYEIPILKADYIFRSLYIPKGHHQITMIFQPESYVLGEMISIITILSLTGYLFYWKLKRNKSKKRL